MSDIKQDASATWLQLTKDNEAGRFLDFLPQDFQPVSLLNDKFDRYRQSYLCTYDGSVFSEHIACS